jgi:hypothetical protein
LNRFFHTDTFIFMWFDELSQDSDTSFFIEFICIFVKFTWQIVIFELIP